MKVLLASKALVVGAHHDKLRALSSLDDMDILAVVPDRWVESGHVAMAEQPSPRGYAIEHVSLVLVSGIAAPRSSFSTRCAPY